MTQPAFAPIRYAVAIIAGIVLAISAIPALADPPARAARISLVSGSASFSPAGSDEWVQARINRPVWIGDRLWSGDGRIELQIGGASVRLAPRTSLQVLNFDDRIAQIELTQGSVALHVRSIDSNETIEVNTPSFAFVTHQEGDYRIDVERDSTAVSTRRGFADIYGQDVAYRIDRRERFAFYSTDLRDYDAGPLPPPDAFDRWVRERAQREDRSTSARYVSPELVGYVDLDSHGDWRVDATYGNVWVPRVEAGWAPYRYGNWTWVDPWGWTWVDDAPWGYAPSHYGRWTRIGPSWAWVPGPRNVRPVYSPALVAWIGGDNFSFSVSSGRTQGVGWFPLAPGEVWRPTYDVSREYFTRVNVANTVVNNTTVVNVYNTRNDVRITNVDYRFRGAPTAVPLETFVQSRPVQLTHSQLAANAAAQANVLPSPRAQPVMRSLVGSAPASQAKPPAESMQRPVVARSAPPAAVPTIEQRAVLVREGAPVTRQVLDRSSPQAPQAAPPAQAAQPQPGQAPAAQAPRESAPGQLRANVRVVDAEKAPPKPLPPAAEGGGRARNDAEKGRPAERPDADKGGRTTVPPGQASPPAEAAPRPRDGAREQPARSGGEGQPPGRAERAPRGDAPAQPEAAPPGKPAPRSEPAPAQTKPPAEGSPVKPQPTPPPQPPASPAASTPQARPAPAAAPAAERRAPEAPRTQEEPGNRRGPDGNSRGEERRPSPQSPSAPAPAATPRPAEGPAAREAAQRPSGEERRATPQAPSAARPAEAPSKPTPPAAAPAAQPAPAAAPAARGAPDKARQDAERDKGAGNGNREDRNRDKDKDKDKEKDKEKDKDKGKG